jgi:RIO kinase 2
LIEGAPLADYAEVPNSELVLREVLENVRKAYDAGVVHADLSEFNILIKPDASVLIIDWPQFVRTDHPNASALLERDVRNVLTYFKRKLGVSMSLDKALTFVGLTRKA